MAQDNTVKAGEYELLDTFWDRPTSSPQDRVQTYHRVYQGEVVKLDEDEAQRLVAGGSVAPKGVRQAAELAAAKARYEALLAAVPDELKAHVDVTAEELQEHKPKPEEQFVHTAGGLVPEGSPRYAAASSGEGNGGPDPQKPGGKLEDKTGEQVGVNPGDGRVDLGPDAGVADSAVATNTDGTRTSRRRA